MAEIKKETRKLVVIEDGLLTTMASSPQYVTQFPFLASLQSKASKKGGCPKCQDKSRERITLYNAAKAALSNMDADNKRKLKAMLNAEEVRVRYADGAKTVVKTF